jgi:hypothetical protein
MKLLSLGHVTQDAGKNIFLSKFRNVPSSRANIVSRRYDVSHVLDTSRAQSNVTRSRDRNK